MRVSLSKVYESSNRLREVVKDEAFYELVESLRSQSLLQPIKVRPTKDGYELIYGHRRTAAMRHLGWAECEAIVENVDDENALVQSALENLHRKDIDVFEEANIYKKLQERGYTLAQIAKLVSKPQGHISNRFSLLRLPAEVQQLVQFGNNQQVTTTELGSISVDSASRIAAAAESPDEAIQLAQKAVVERLTGMEVRELTGKFKQTRTSSERKQLIETPFHNLTEPLQGITKPILPESSKLFHTANRSIGDQFHSKLIWNLKRIDLTHFSHFTIGYSQRNWDQVAELLEIAGITALVDARRNPVSQYKPEFSKTNLRNLVENAGIRYFHLPELGVDTEDREDLAQDHDYDTLFATYDERVNINLLKTLLGNKLEKERLAFLCVEIDPETCHRHRIAQTIEQMGYLTYDL